MTEDSITEILKLVFDYSIKGKLADNKFVDKIVEIVVKNRNLHEYVRDVESFDAVGIAASYDFLTRRIAVNYRNIYSSFDVDLEHGIKLFNILEQNMYKNLDIALVILHELEHALQHKQADTKECDSITLKLINASTRLVRAVKNPKFLVAQGLDNEISPQQFAIYCEMERKLYKKYYLFTPMERMANVNSFNTIILSLEPIRQLVPILYGIEKAVLFKESAKVYQSAKKEGGCPTQVYLEGTRQGNVWTEFDFYDLNGEKLIENVSAEYDLGKRISLGLPISQDEFNMMDSAKIQM